MNSKRNAHDLINQLPAPSFTNADLADVHPRILPAFVRSELGQQYQFLDRNITSSEMAKRLKDPIIKPGGVEPFAKGEKKFQYPEYNFSEIITIIETEPLVARAFSRKETMCLKQGWDIIGKNQKTVEYIKNRFTEIEHVSGLSLNQLVRDIAADLISFSNWFGTIVRNSKFSSGRRRNIGGIETEPIAGIFTIPPETVLLRFNKKGNVDALAQEIWGDSITQSPKHRATFSRGKYLHFKINERKGYSVGTPLLVATKDDIMALRRIEENVEILLYQYLFPLYKYQVGTLEAPAKEFPGGLTEVDLVQRKWSELPPEGAMVVPERHDIEVLGAKGSAIDANPYLSYFQERVLAGLEISSLDIGKADTSNRSTSDSLSRILIDGVKYLQRRIEWNINSNIIKPLLMESTFSDEEVMNPENAVHFRFREIDIDALIKIQNHQQQIYSSHGITETEFRRELGREPYSEEERNDTFWKRIDEPRELIKSKSSGFSAEAMALAENENSAISEEGISKEQEAEMNKNKSNQNGGSSGSGENLTAGQRQSNSRNRPSNQFSNQSVYKLIFSDTTVTADPASEIISRNSLMSYWNASLDQLRRFTFNSEDISKLFAINLFAANDSFNKYLLSKVYEGIRDVLQEAGSNEFSFNIPVPKLLILDIKNQVSKLINKLVSDVNKKTQKLRLDKDLPALDLINTLTFRVKFIDGNETSRSYNLGRALAYRHLNYQEVKIVPMKSDSCDKCKEIKVINLNDFTYLELPPLAHPNARQIIVGVKK